ncbi:MAG: site-specific integrase [Proteobacteria bacterium]|nr:site-specific integrase [Pseudomonadota bacterium]
MPVDIQPVLGKNELWLPLGPGEYAGKVRAARVAAVRADAMFADARRAGRGELAAVDDSGAASEAELRQWAVRILWEKERAALSMVPASDDAEDTSYADELRQLIALLRHPSQPDTLSLLSETIGAIKRLGVAAPLPPVKLVLGRELPQPGPMSPQLARAIELMRRVYIEHYQRQLDRFNGGHGEAVHDPLFTGITAASHEVPVTLDRAPTLIQAIRRFEADPTRKHLTDSAEKKYRLPFRALREIAGDARPLVEVSRADCAAAQELIASIPPNVSKLKPYAKLKTMREIAALASQRKDLLMSVGNVRVAVQHMASFFNWAITKGLINANPGTRLAPSKTRTERKRRPFNVDELNVMLRSLPEWAEARASGRFWVPLIGLFMGLRLGEIVWLQAQEVQEIAGRPMLRLWRTAERSLKTDGSERIVPVHPVLLELGFLQRVATVREQGWQRVFQDLPGENQKRCADLFQKRFAYWQKKKLKLDREGTSFHSFRHGFRDALTRAKAPNDVMRSLGGWARGGGVENQYGQGAQPDLLAETMDRIDFPGLEWRMLARRKAVDDPSGKPP